VAARLTKPVGQSELLDVIVGTVGAAASSMGGRHAQTDRRPESLASLKVLLAEDSLVNRKLAIGLLERRGYQVVAVKNGKQAVDAVRSQPFDLVLMDVEMPEMDGLEATRIIRAAEKETGAHVPIVALTARAMKGDREHCLAVGVDGYVSKPIRADQLYQAIEASVLARPARPREDESAERAGVDWAEALASVRNDRDLLKTVVEAFLEECPQVMGQVRRAVDGEDASGLRLAAHTLKGSMRLFGHTPASDHADALETMGRNGDLSGAQQTLVALERGMEDLLPVLKDYLDSP
jgi:CheY-like chemotaxis protein/HPt (histidine-containing phosphotransfer) domain-containing protein